MEKKWKIILMIAIIIFALVIGIYFYKSKQVKPEGNYNAEKTETSVTQENYINNETQTNEENLIEQERQKAQEAEQAKQQEAERQQKEQEKQENVAAKEIEIASFSTKIYSKDSSRQNNINITCSKLNNVSVLNGKTFSFCNTIGPSSASKGYQKADIFVDGEKEKGYGGRKLPG